MWIEISSISWQYVNFVDFSSKSNNFFYLIYQIIKWNKRKDNTCIALRC